MPTTRIHAATIFITRDNNLFIITANLPAKPSGRVRRGASVFDTPVLDTMCHTCPFFAIVRMGVPDVGNLRQLIIANRPLNLQV